MSGARCGFPVAVTQNECAPCGLDVGHGGACAPAVEEAAVRTIIVSAESQQEARIAAEIAEQPRLVISDPDERIDALEELAEAVTAVDAGRRSCGWSKLVADHGIDETRRCRLCDCEYDTRSSATVGYRTHYDGCPVPRIEEAIRNLQRAPTRGAQSGDRFNLDAEIKRSEEI